MLELYQAEQAECIGVVRESEILGMTRDIRPMVSWECPTKPREASGLDPEAVHESDDIVEYLEEHYA